jgi:hypothetical protein
VGEHNYKFFLGFISSHSAMCFFGAYISLKYLNFVIDDMGLWNLQFKSSSGKVLDASGWVIFRFLFDQFEIPMFLFVICIVLGFALLGFTLYHINLINKGVSMSEAAKLADFTAKLKRTKEHFEKRVDIFKQNFPDCDTDQEQKKLMQKEMKKKFDKEWRDFQKEIDIMVKNYSAKPFLTTFKEVLKA